MFFDNNVERIDATDFALLIMSLSAVVVGFYISGHLLR